MPALPYCVRKANSRHGKQARNFKWSVKGPDGVVVHLACPSCDSMRGIFVVWNPVEDRVYYTDTDLSDIDSMADNAIKSIDWRELREGLPFFARRSWYYYDRFTVDPATKNDPGTKKLTAVSFLARDTDFQMRGTVGLIVAHDGKREFFAQINDCVKPRFLPSDLSWCISVPVDPESRLRDGSFDRRLVKASDLPRTTFLVDTVQRQTLYWHVRDQRWEQYTVRDPGWGFTPGGGYAGGSGGIWDRDGVVVKEGVYLWRDPITHNLYALERGVDFATFQKLLDMQLDKLRKCLDENIAKCFSAWETFFPRLEILLIKEKKDLAEEKRTIIGEKNELEKSLRDIAAGPVAGFYDGEVTKHSGLVFKRRVQGIEARVREIEKRLSCIDDDFAATVARLENFPEEMIANGTLMKENIQKGHSFVEEIISCCSSLDDLVLHPSGIAKFQRLVNMELTRFLVMFMEPDRLGGKTDAVMVGEISEPVKHIVNHRKEFVRFLDTIMPRINKNKEAVYENGVQKRDVDGKLLFRDIVDGFGTEAYRGDFDVYGWVVQLEVPLLRGTLDENQWDLCPLKELPDYGYSFPVEEVAPAEVAPAEIAPVEPVDNWDGPTELSEADRVAAEAASEAARVAAEAASEAARVAAEAASEADRVEREKRIAAQAERDRARRRVQADALAEADRWRQRNPEEWRAARIKNLSPDEIRKWDADQRELDLRETENAAARRDGTMHCVLGPCPFPFFLQTQTPAAGRGGRPSAPVPVMAVPVAPACAPGLPFDVSASVWTVNKEDNRYRYFDRGQRILWWLPWEKAESRMVLDWFEVKTKRQCQQEIYIAKCNSYSAWKRNEDFLNAHANGDLAQTLRLTKKTCTGPGINMSPDGLRDPLQTMPLQGTRIYPLTDVQARFFGLEVTAAVQTEGAAKQRKAAEEDRAQGEKDALLDFVRRKEIPFLQAIARDGRGGDESGARRDDQRDDRKNVTDGNERVQGGRPRNRDALHQARQGGDDGDRTLHHSGPAWVRHPAPEGIDSRDWSLMLRYLLENPDVYRDKVLVDPIYTTGEYKMAVIKHRSVCSVHECISDYVAIMGDIDEFHVRNDDQGNKIKVVTDFVEVFQEIEGDCDRIEGEIKLLMEDRLMSATEKRIAIETAEDSLRGRGGWHEVMYDVLDKVYAPMVLHLKGMGAERLARKIPASVLVGMPMKKWYEAHEDVRRLYTNWVDVFAVADMLDVAIQIFDIDPGKSLQIYPAVCAPLLNPIRQDLLEGGIDRPLSVVRETVGNGAGAYQVFHLALPEAQYVRSRLRRYFLANRTQLVAWEESIREAKAGDFFSFGDSPAPEDGSGTASDRLKAGDTTKGRDLVRTEGGDVIRDFEGGVPVFRLLIKEQPPTNYSFFTACRDAAAAHFKLAPEEIPSVFHFIRDWMDHLAYLSDSVMSRFFSASAQQFVMSGARNDDKIRAHIIAHVVSPMRAALEYATDLCVTDAQLWILCLAGLPVRACSVTLLDTEESDVSLCFYRCYEVGDRLDVRTKIVLSGKAAATAVCIPLLELVSGEAEWTTDGFRRGGSVAHHYHLGCAPDPEIKIDKHRPLTRKFDQHLHDFLAQGFHDPNFDDICPVPGEEHPQWFSEDYQRHRGMAMHMGVVAGGGLYRPEDFQVGHTAASVYGAADGNGGQVMVWNPDSSGRQVVKNWRAGTSVAVVSYKQTNTAMSRPKAYVTNVHQFPLFSYFESMREHPLCPYPGVNHLPPSIRSPAVPGALPLEDPGFGEDGLLRVVGQDAYTYKFEDVIASCGAPARRPVLLEGFPAGDRLHAHYWELSENDKILPSIKTGVPFPPHLELGNMVVPGRRARALARYKAAVVVSLVDEEHRRLRVWRDRFRENKRSSLMDGTCSATFDASSQRLLRFDDTSLVRADEEPPSAVYGGVLPSYETFQQSILPLFEEEVTALVGGWVDAFAACDERALAGKTPCPSREELLRFYGSYFIPCLEAFVDLERMQHIRARVGDALLVNGVTESAGDSVGGGVVWKSRMPARVGAKHRIPDFLSQPLRGPCNVALTPWLASCGFEQAPAYANHITDLCSSSFETAPVGGDLDRVANKFDYKNDLMRRLGRTHFIGGIDSETFPGQNKFPQPAPLTMDALCVLTNTYCSTREEETHRNGFVSRPFPSINFVVVERAAPSSLPGHLHVVLHSDPRGLSLARGLIQLRAHLPTTKDIDGDATLAKKRELLQLCRDAHTLAHVAVILRVPDGGSFRFHLLKAVHVAPHSLAMRRPDNMIVNPMAALASARVFLSAVRAHRGESLDHVPLEGRPRGTFVSEPDKAKAALLEMEQNDAHRMAFTAFYRLSDEQVNALTWNTRSMHLVKVSSLPEAAQGLKCRIVALKLEGGVLRYVDEYDHRLCVGVYTTKTHYVLVGDTEPPVTRYLVPRGVKTVYSTLDEYVAVQNLHIAYTKKLFDKSGLAVRVLEGLAALGRTLGVFAPVEPVQLPGVDGKLASTDVHDGPDERVWNTRLAQRMAPLDGRRMVARTDGGYDISECEKYT